MSPFTDGFLPQISSAQFHAIMQLIRAMSSYNAWSGTRNRRAYNRIWAKARRIYGVLRAQGVRPAEIYAIRTGGGVPI